MDRYADLPDSTLPSPAVAAARGDREQVEALTRVCVADLLSAFGLGETRNGALRRPLVARARVRGRPLGLQVAA